MINFPTQEQYLFFTLREVMPRGWMKQQMQEDLEHGFDRFRPWRRPPLLLKGTLQDQDGEHCQVTMVPFGSTELRQTTFQT